MAGVEEVKLLGLWPSPFVLRARIALSIKGVEYEFVEETMAPKSDLLLKSNPVYKKIPVLIHQGKPVCESMIIVQYIDEAWAGEGKAPLLPSDPYDRAIARFWAVYIDDKFLPSMMGMGKAQTEEAKAEAASQAFASLLLLEEAFSSCSKGKAFFNGDSIGYLDIALGCNLGWIKAIEKMSGVKVLDEAKMPQLVGWADRFCEDAAVKEVMPETEKLVEFAKVMQAKWKADAPTN